ncbi:Pollen receptor-like kinase 4, partial [Zea mays]
ARPGIGAARTIDAGQFTRRRQVLAPAGWLPGTGAAAPAHPRDTHWKAADLRPAQGGGALRRAVVVPAEAGAGGGQHRPGDRRGVDAGGRVAEHRGGPGPAGRGGGGQGGDGEADQGRHGVLREQRGQPVGAQDRHREDRGAQGEGAPRRGASDGDRRGLQRCCPQLIIDTNRPGIDIITQILVCFSQ